MHKIKFDMIIKLLLASRDIQVIFWKGYLVVRRRLVS